MAPNLRIKSGIGGKENIRLVTSRYFSFHYQRKSGMYNGDSGRQLSLSNINRLMIYAIAQNNAVLEIT